MVITNGLVFTEDFRFARLDLAYDEGRITRLAPAGSLADQNAYDAGGGFVLPGFVDIHTHGCAGGDFSDADPAGIETMLAAYASRGVTSVVATTLSLPPEQLKAVFAAGAPFVGKDGYGAVLHGFHMEGPFLSPQKNGAHDRACLRPPSLPFFEEMVTASGGHIRLVDLAPELPGALAFLSAAARHCAVSLAHSTATYQQAADAFTAGASHVSHLFNGMAPFHQREPGLVGAAFDYASFVEVVSDGVHLHPCTVRTAFKWFGENRICLVSDSMRGTGMPDGRYTLGALTVEKQGERATLPDGTIAGSVSGLPECCRRAVHFGVPIEQAVRAATANPAAAAGLIQEVGTLTVGKRADILVWNQDMLPVRVISGGETVFD